jgi:hypothetical protein
MKNKIFNVFLFFFFFFAAAGADNEIWLQFENADDLSGSW